LLIIGGPTDVVVEANIVRVAGAPREVPPARPSTIGDTLPRAVPLAEGTPWPLQPEPATRIEPSLRPEPAPRSQRPPAPAAEERPEWPEPETAPAPMPRERRTRPEALAGLAEELSRAPPSAESERTAAPLRREGRTRPLPTGAAPSAGESKISSSADQNLADKNLADMAQRLEAALRRPAKSDEAPSDTGKAEAEDSDMESRPPAAQAQRPPISERSKPVRAEPRLGRGEEKAAGQSSLYDSLEQEMASLLGRPNKG
jgi:flagellar protein FliO/FliZ